MVRPKKAHSKKQQRGSIDFKKIKRKVGRKLPPPRNATNTKIKSKAIVLPEQSVASDRVGLAVSSKGLTLKELLQQSSHHNARFRRSALIGIRDLLLKHPSELKLHKLVIIEKLRERVCDNDKVVRDAFYQLLKTVIFASPKEESSDSSISLIMAYVFNAMTHLVLDIRLMAFKFFDLIMMSCPSSAFLFAEKVLDHYKDILQNSQIYLQDSGKLKTALLGLANFLALLAFDTEKVDNQDGQDTLVQRPLHAFVFEPPKEHESRASIFKRLEELIPVLVHSFKQFAPVISEVAAVDVQSFDCACSVLQCIKLVACLLLRKGEESQSSNIMAAGCYSMSKTFTILMKLWDLFPVTSDKQLTEKEDDRCYTLNVRIAEIFLQSTKGFEKNDDQMKFLEFIESSLYGQLYSARQSAMAQDKYLVALLQFFPSLISQVTSDWRIRLLKGFTHVFLECKVESKLNLACLAAIEEMLLRGQGTQQYDLSDPDILVYQSSWLQKLPGSLLQLNDANPALSKVILRLILHIGQWSPPNSHLDFETNNLQFLLKEFYCIRLGEGNASYGPFLKLPKDCQELSVCSLYYFSNLNSEFLQSVAYCCMCSDLEPSMALRILDILHSSYRVGHIHITDYMSFLVTVVSRFEICNGQFHVGGDLRKFNLKAYRAVSKAILFSLLEMGDGVLVLRLLQKKILDEMSLKPSTDNMHSLLRMISVLDSELSNFSEEETSILSQFLSNYVIDVAARIPAIISEDNFPASWGYYIKPCILLFHGNEKIFRCVMQFLTALILDSSSPFAFSTRVNTVVLILVSMLEDRVKQNVPSTKQIIQMAVKNITFLSSAETNLNLEEQHKIQRSLNLLKAMAQKANVFDANELQSEGLT